MRTLIAALAALLTLAPLPAAAQDEDRYQAQKVAYHVNGDGGEGGKAYFAALRNVQNHVDAVGEGKIEAAIVMHGDGLGLLMLAADDQRLQSAIGSLKGQRVRFLVCNNTLVGRDIDWQEDLYDVWEDDIVPSGVAELSHLQQMGYTYIKP